MSHGKYARLKVILEEKFPFNYQSLEFVAKTRILVEMKIENHGGKIFPRKNKLTSIYIFF